MFSVIYTNTYTRVLHFLFIAFIICRVRDGHCHCICLESNVSFVKFLGSNIGFGVSIESKSFMVFFWGRQSPVTKLYIQFIFRDHFF